MIRQLNFYFNIHDITKYWICFEIILLGVKPVIGKQQDFIYIYWLLGGIQIGRNNP